MASKREENGAARSGSVHGHAGGRDEDRGGRSWSRYDDDYYGSQGGRDAARLLRPLVERMEHYDRARIRLEQKGGRPSDLRLITSMLRDPIPIDDGYRRRDVSLSEPAQVRTAVHYTGGYDVRWQVRRLDTRMPVFYLCRVRADYLSEYSLIVEDLYQSPGYPMPDGRFVPLMRAGHEVPYLRLAPYREAARRLLDATDRRAARETDRLLYDTGRHVLQSAWHEDQRLSASTTQHFGAPSFAPATELLYLCLSGDLCRLRGEVRRSLVDFFDVVYPQPPIRALLHRLPEMDGSTLSAVPREALRLYGALGQAFGRFLHTEVVYGAGEMTLPLYKVLFANVDRLGLVAARFRKSESVTRAARQLDEAARTIATTLLETSAEGSTF